MIADCPGAQSRRVLDTAPELLGRSTRHDQQTTPGPHVLGLGCALLLMACATSGAAADAQPEVLTRESIDSGIAYLGQYLSVFPPLVQDSAEARRLEDELADLISRVASSQGALERFAYNWTLGQLYSFAFNLNMDSAWENCDRHLKEAIGLRPDSVRPKILLAAFYGGSTNPADSSSMSRQQYALNMLSQLRRDGADVKHPLVNYNLCLSALMLGRQPLMVDAGYEYWRQMPRDSNAAAFRKLFEQRKARCGHLSIGQGHKVYANSCLNFRVKYPEALILFGELTDTAREHMAILQTETPLVMNSEGVRMRNAISVASWDLQHVDRDAKIGSMMRQLGSGKVLPRLISLPSLRSSYEFVQSDATEGFHSILTLFVTNENLFALMYVATNSTYEKNLGYYEAFERGFTITQDE